MPVALILIYAGTGILIAAMIALLHMYVRILVRMEVQRLIDLYDTEGTIDPQPRPAAPSHRY